MSTSVVNDPVALKELCLEAIENGKGKEPLAINVEEYTDVMSWIVVASGTSSRHAESVVEHVVKAAKAEGVQTLGKEGGAGSDWFLVDLGDVVVNVMMPDARRNYDLERLWTDGEISAPSAGA